MRDLIVTFSKWMDELWNASQYPCHYGAGGGWHAWCPHYDNVTSDAMIASPYTLPFILNESVCHWTLEDTRSVGNNSVACTTGDWSAIVVLTAEFAVVMDNCDAYVTASLDLTINWEVAGTPPVDPFGAYHYSTATKEETNLGPHGSQRALCSAIDTWIRNGIGWTFPIITVTSEGGGALPPGDYPQWEATIS